MPDSNGLAAKKNKDFTSIYKKEEIYVYKSLKGTAVPKNGFKSWMTLHNL